MIKSRWNKYPNFREEEFKCKETGECEMTLYFLDKLQEIRTKYGKPMIINSGYRSTNHSLERVKAHRGEHTMGIAADISVYGEHALLLVKVAIECGINRIGLNQRGELKDRFIHLGIGDLGKGFPKGIWSY